MRIYSIINDITIEYIFDLTQFLNIKKAYIPVRHVIILHILEEQYAM